MKLVYPCILRDEKVGWSVIFTEDAIGATSGETLEEAVYMAQDLANFSVQDMIENNEEIPTPTPPEKVEVPPGAFMTLIRVDTDAYRKS